ncbi:hypothetical protein EVAR_72556_1 [Eumeta japonica]|uniref:Uncharacterized protein n=1 Tax=Eumeta variegata TaxID=151549 RepID=A0A4C2A5W3_EUMVA|nr:hypothetical protein EVAR_72556_1 [Eumeta japonica]
MHRLVTTLAERDIPFPKVPEAIKQTSGFELASLCPLCKPKAYIEVWLLSQLRPFFIPGNVKWLRSTRTEFSSEESWVTASSFISSKKASNVNGFEFRLLIDKNAQFPTVMVKLPEITNFTKVGPIRLSGITKPWDSIREENGELLRLSKPELSRMMGVVTVHSQLLAHLSRINVTKDHECRAREEDSETLEHYLCHCPVLSRIRSQYFGIDTLPAMTRLRGICWSHWSALW